MNPPVIPDLFIEALREANDDQVDDVDDLRKRIRALRCRRDPKDSQGIPIKFLTTLDAPARPKNLLYILNELSSRQLHFTRSSYLTDVAFIKELALLLRLLVALGIDLKKNARIQVPRGMTTIGVYLERRIMGMAVLLAGRRLRIQFNFPVAANLLPLFAYQQPDGVISNKHERRSPAYVLEAQTREINQTLKWYEPARLRLIGRMAGEDCLQWLDIQTLNPKYLYPMF